jgi:hypothetical protein
LQSSNKKPQAHYKSGGSTILKLGDLGIGEFECGGLQIFRDGNCGAAAMRVFLLATDFIFGVLRG